jgi:hypothetical protein
MFEIYLGLVPGDAHIDRLVAGTLPDPALAPVESASAVRDLVPPDSLWRRMLVRWGSASHAPRAVRHV